VCILFLSGMPLHKHITCHSYVARPIRPHAHDVLHLYHTSHAFLCVSYSWVGYHSTSTPYIIVISYESLIHKHIMCYTCILHVTHSCVCHILERIAIPQAHYTLNVYHMMSPSSTNTWYVTLKSYKSLILVCVIFLSGLRFHKHIIH